METVWNGFATLQEIESRFDEHKVMPWMRWFWPSCFVFSALYVTIIFGGTYLMRNREPFVLRRALCMWSAGLAAFSIIAVIRIIPSEYDTFLQGGVTFLTCDLQFLTGSSRKGLWAFFFMFSKLPELGDTIFIVLRKGNVSFLHWYHHISVMAFTWWSYVDPIGPGLLFGTVNYFVHAVMYTYYAIKASGRNPPRFIARCITTLQLSQMFLGVYWNYIGVREMYYGRLCAMSELNVQLALVMYVSYIILFSNFYYWTYIAKKPKKQQQAFTEKASNGSIKTLSNGVLPQNGHVVHRNVNQ